MKTLSRRHFLQLGTATAATVSVTACSGNEHSASIDTSLPVGPFGADATAELVTEGMTSVARPRWLPAATPA